MVSCFFVHYQWRGAKPAPAWLAQFTSYDNDRMVQPFLSTDPYGMPDDFDPPHKCPNMAANLGTLQNNAYSMNGFVSAIPSLVSTNSNVRKLAMSYFGAA